MEKGYAYILLVIFSGFLTVTSSVYFQTSDIGVESPAPLPEEQQEDPHQIKIPEVLQSGQNSLSKPFGASENPCPGQLFPVVENIYFEVLHSPPDRAAFLS